MQARLQKTSRFVLPLAVLLATGAAVALSGCAGGSQASADAVLKRTFGAPHVYKSGKLAASIDLDGQGLTGSGGRLAMSLDGPFSSNGGGNVPSFSMATAVALGGRRVKLNLTSNGKAMWLGVAGLEYTLPPTVFKAFSQSWANKGARSSGSLLDRAGFRPGDWLKNPHIVGDENVAGTETVHVQSDVDGAKLVADLGSLLGTAGSLGGGVVNVPAPDAKTTRKLAAAVKNAQLNVWSGKSDGALRRMSVNVEVGAVGAQRPTTLRLDFTIADLNQPQAISAPNSPRPFSELAGLMTAATGLGAQGAKVPGSKASEFEKCVQSSANLEAAKRCSQALTG